MTYRPIEINATPMTAPDHFRLEGGCDCRRVRYRLRERFQPGRVVLVSHSRGAALSAVLLAMKPGLADAGRLIGCPSGVADATLQLLRR